LGTPSENELNYPIGTLTQELPLFQHGSTIKQIFPGLDLNPTGFDLLMKMFIIDPSKRITAK